VNRDDLGIQLGLAYAAFVEWLNAQMADAGFDDLGATFGYIFRALADGPATLSDLAAGLHMTTQGTAKILAEMEAREYVSRQPHPTDARSRLVQLADRGQRALDTAHALHRRYEERLVGQVGADSVVALRRALAAVQEVGDVDPASRLLRPI
jgi:DNA-binding MarR family transcriptional regulator